MRTRRTRPNYSTARVQEDICAYELNATAAIYCLNYSHDCSILAMK